MSTQHVAIPSLHFVAMTEEQKRREQGERLAAARLAAGFRSARAAALECHWPESTYRAHEGGSRTIGLDDADKYTRKFRALGAKGFSSQYILFGTRAGERKEESLDALVADLDPERRALIYDAVKGMARK